MEAVESRERRSHTHNGAVWIRYDKTLAETAFFSLNIDQPDVISIDLRDQQRHIFVHSIARGIANDGVARTSERLFRLAGN